MKERAKARLPSQRKSVSKLRAKKISAEAEAAKLRFKAAEVLQKEMNIPKRSPALTRTARVVSAGTLHTKTTEYEDDNIGTKAMNETAGMGETAAQTVQSGLYSRRMTRYKQSEKSSSGFNANPISRWRQRKAIKQEYAAVRAGKATGAYTSGMNTADNASKAAEKGMTGFTGKAKDLGKWTVNTVQKNPHIILIAGILAIIILVISSSLSSCSAMLSGTGNAVLATSFTATDEDIRGAEADYRAMEAELREKILKIRENNPDYDEYEINTEEINHNPYELAAFLTVLYEDYHREDVQKTLKDIFKAQYEYSTSHRTETVTETKQIRVGESLGQVVTSGYCNCPICCGKWSGGPTASGVYPTANHTIAVDAYNPFVPMGTKVIMNGTEYTVEDTGAFDRYGVQFDVYYDDHWTATLHGHKTWEAYIADDNGSNVVEVTKTETKRILTVKVINHSLNSVVESWGLSDEQLERYHVLVAQKGNRDYLFPDDIYANPGDVLHYDIPGEALSDVRFARMMQEAEKYLGYPYVWGGSNPSTSFDCSGFVSWVCNHCGNGWNFGRLGVDGLLSLCAVIPRSEARPGDLIFFERTYDVTGASHVGIYVGNGMMIHCGNPIQYANIDSNYWRDHFYCFGRLP